jgi:hypothetical protein
VRSRLSLVRAIGLILAVILVSAARAAPGLAGPAALSTGFNADTLLFDDDQVSVWFPRMEQLDSTWVRIPVVWNGIAPASRPAGFNATNPGDPNYHWFILDRAVRAAAASRQRVLLTIVGPPRWALGSGAPRTAWPGTWRPNAAAYGAFAHAVAARYSGHFSDPSRPGAALPRVTAFQPWNEPNLPTTLEPQWTRTRHGFIATSPGIYRGLLNAAYVNIKSAQPHAQVVAAGLAPYGDAPGVARMRPVQFLRGLVCLQGGALRPERCPDPPHFDAIDIHPYAVTPTHHAFSADDVSVADIRKLWRVLSVASRTHRALPAGPKPIWANEIGWDSFPPDPAGIPLTREAHYLARTLYELWQQGVSHVMWYEVRDVGAPARFEPYGGLFFRGGSSKPATLAFRFPFVALRARPGITTLWGRSPTRGPVAIEAERRGRWRRLLILRPTSGGIFYARRRLGSHLTLRARVGPVVSYPWSTG